MKLLLKKRVYVILAMILFIAVSLELTRTEFILQWSFQKHPGGQQEMKKKVNAVTAEQIAQLPTDHWTIVYDPNDEYSNRLMSNASMVLKYMHQATEVRPYPAFVFPKVGKSAVVVALDDLSWLRNTSTITDYIEQGGYVFFLTMPEKNDSLYQIYRKLGMNEIGDLFAAQGLTLTSNVIMNGEGEFFTEKFILNSVQLVNLEPDCTILAETIDGVPLMWERKLGKGKLILFNGTVLADKNNRGLVAGGISRLIPNYMYPIINTKMMYIDDFPAPVPQGVNAKIYKEYKRDIPRFYRDVWWPDMIELASRYGYVYTTAVIQSYNNLVQPSFDNPVDAQLDNLVMYGREVLKHKGEIGVHGYNHQSLHMDPAVMELFGYGAWQKQSDMVDSIKTVLNYIEQGFPWYKAVSYVPPSNVMSQEGRSALKQAWPELDNIGSVYIGDPEVDYVQEFEVAPDGVVEIPRVTSGYNDSEPLRWEAINAMNTVGVFSHFVHPDDILNEERSFGGMTWAQLSKQFEKFLKFIDQKYRWARSQTVRESSAALRDWSESQIYTVRKENLIEGYVNQFAGELFFIFRTNQAITKLEQCSADKIDDGIYLVRVTGEKFFIGLDGSK